ncbi:MAG: DUF4123 domain-containing protein [Kofleriaceae bacterium]
MKEPNQIIDGRRARLVDSGVVDYWVRYLARQPHHVFAVIDPARDPSLLKKFTCEPIVPELGAFGPHVTVANDELVTRAWGNASAIFAVCSYPMTALVQHCARLFESQLETGEEIYFRFYDPRVLRAVARVCDEDERLELLGPVHSFLVEDRVATYAHDISRAGITGVGVPA